MEGRGPAVTVCANEYAHPKARSWPQERRQPMCMAAAFPVILSEAKDLAVAAAQRGILVAFMVAYRGATYELSRTQSGAQRNPPILILDEATSSVDTETEMLIQQALERLVENRTTFAIAHRLSTLRKASRIIVLERGRVVEMGTHGELLDGDGLYGRLCKLQSELSRVTAW